MLPMRLSDECHLRGLEETDAPELYALIDTNRAHLAPWMPWAATQDLDATMEFIRGTRRQLADDNGFQVAITAAEQIIGVVGFHAVNWGHRSTSIGYWLDEQHQGHGTMTRAVRALVDHALSVWELNRIEIRVASGNSRSRAIPRRLGFHEEGTLRQAERVGDRYVDSVVYSMLASDDRSPTEDDERQQVLSHLSNQTRYVASLATWAADNPHDPDVLLRLRDEIFTLRETLDTLGVPHALADNAAWAKMPPVENSPSWPSAADGS